MKKKSETVRNNKLSLPVFLLIIGLLTVMYGDAWAVIRESDNPFSKAEMDWIAGHPDILAAPDPDFPPVEYFDGEGFYRGIAADYISLIGKRLGIRFKIRHLKDWDEVLRKARAGEIDMVTMATPTPQRKKYLRFTSSIIELPVVIIVRQNVKKKLTMSDLKGMKVAVVYRYATHDYITNTYPDMHLDLVRDVQTGLRKVAFGMVDAMVANIASASYNIEKEKITNLRLAGKSGFILRLAFAPLKENIELNSILEKGLGLITEKEKQEIYSKWITLQRDSLFKKREFWISIGVGLGIFLLSIGGILTWNRTLRLRVAEKTAALRQKVIEHQIAEKAIMESETRYKQIIENTKSGVAVLKAVDDGNDFIFLDLNKSGEKIDKLKKNALIGRSILEIYPNLKAFGLLDVLRRVWKTGRSERHPVALYKDHRINMWRDTFVYKLSADEVATVYSDETELKVLQAETLKAGHLASIGELAAGVAHEINNPINSVINLAQILSNESSNESLQKDVAGRIIKEGNRIAGIVGNLLSFARDRKDRKTLVSLSDIVDETLSLTKAQIQKDGIHLKVDIPETLPVFMGHLQQIQQVFLNIINNARYALNQKYPTGDSDKILKISAVTVNHNNSLWVRAKFLDHGTGISEKNIEHIMDPFFTTKPTGEGTGLGLSIGHGIVSDHDGKLKIKSREGVYTLVFIDFPAGDNNDT